MNIHARLSTPSYPSLTTTLTSSDAYSDPPVTTVYSSTQAVYESALIHAAHAHALSPHHVTQPPSPPSSSHVFITAAPNNMSHQQINNNNNEATNITQQHIATHSFIHIGFMSRKYGSGSSNNNPHSPTQHFYRISSTPGGFAMPSSTSISPFRLSFHFLTRISVTNLIAHAAVHVVRSASGGSSAQVHVTVTTQHALYSKPSHHKHQATLLSRKSLRVP